MQLETMDFKPLCKLSIKVVSFFNMILIDYQFWHYGKLLNLR